MSVKDCPGGDCESTWCDFCGCCQHGPDENGCRMQDAPAGVSCRGSGGCGCEGEGEYVKPVRRPERSSESADRSRQEHQETSLFDLEPTSVSAK